MWRIKSFVSGAPIWMRQIISDSGSLLATLTVLQVILLTAAMLTCPLRCTREWWRSCRRTCLPLRTCRGRREEPHGRYNSRRAAPPCRSLTLVVVFKGLHLCQHLLRLGSAPTDINNCWTLNWSFRGVHLCFCVKCHLAGLISVINNIAIICD